MNLRELGREVGSAVLQRVGRIASRVQESKPLAADILEGEDAYLVVFDAPGATGSDVQVRYADGTVHVRIDRFRDFYEGFEMVFPGRGLALDGQAELPDDALVDVEHAAATLTREGTLEIRVPKEGTSAEVESPGEPTT
jgi:HSP20 family molecular chaperone IbpA